MRRSFPLFLAIGVLWATPAVSFAWNAAGHMLIALIAYEQMTPPQRQAMVAILKKHPRFKEDFLERMPPDVRGQSQAVQDQWIFMHASTWPDIARGFRGTLRNKYHHGPWHYINVPIFLTDADRAAMEDRLPVPTRRDWSPDANPDPQNAPQAYQKCMLEWSDRHTPDADKAVALCWVLHLIGDIHQPLHACALFSKAQFPEGDHGGNYLIIEPNQALHSYWDGLMGSDTSLSALIERHRELIKTLDDESLGSVAVRAMSFDRWIDESHRLADERVYTAEMRRIVKETKRSAGKHDIHIGRLTPAYQEESHLTAQRRVLEAGYRTAKALEPRQPER